MKHGAIVDEHDGDGCKLILIYALNPLLLLLNNPLFYYYAEHKNNISICLNRNG